MDSVLEGYNGTIFAYGQTGCGKTFTMAGVETSEELRGVTPRGFRHIFEAIANLTGRNYMVRASYLEIYNEEIRDLLAKDQNKTLDLRENPERGVYVQDLTQIAVRSVDELESVLRVGTKNRTVGATAMNQDSSRSHSIFTVTVECVGKEEGDATAPANHDQGTGGHIRVGKLNFVDLAGSERQSKTQASGVRLKEATKINMSLSALGNVISALVDGKTSHVPYRDSKLTRMLQDSLGGNTKTVMCAAISPADYNFDETMSTLRYANRAKSIKNKPKINEDPKDAMIREMQEKIAEMKRQLEEGGGAPGIPPKVIKKKVVEEGPREEELEAIRAQMMADVKAKMEAALTEKAREEAKQEAEASARAALEALLHEQDRSDAQRKSIREALSRQHQEMAAYSTQIEEEMQRKAALEAQLREMEGQVLVGGVNLVEHTEELMNKEEEVAREMMIQRRQEAEQRRQIENLKQEVMLDQQQYKDVQDEVQALKTRIKEVQQRVRDRAAEAGAVQGAQQKEREDMLAQVRELEQIIKLRDLAISWFIPPAYLDAIKEACYQDEETEEWGVRFSELAGNAVLLQRQQAQAAEAGRERRQAKAEEATSFFTYRQLREDSDVGSGKGSGGSGKGSRGGSRSGSAGGKSRGRLETGRARSSGAR